VGGGTDSVGYTPEYAGAVDDKTGEARTCRPVVQAYTYLVFVDESDECMIEMDSMSMIGVEEGMIGMEEGVIEAEEGMIGVEEGMIGVQGGKGVVGEAQSGLGVAGPRLNH
jgi:hypothetical protein